MRISDWSSDVCSSDLTRKACVVFSMEMSAPQLAFRLISSIGRINQQRLRTGQLEDEDWSRVNHAIRMLSEAKMFIDDTPALSPDVLRRSEERRVGKEWVRTCRARLWP